MKAEIAALIIHIPRKLSEPTPSKAGPEHDTHPGDQQTRHYHQSSDIWHLRNDTIALTHFKWLSANIFFRHGVFLLP